MPASGCASSSAFTLPMGDCVFVAGVAVAGGEANEAKSESEIKTKVSRDRII